MTLERGTARLFRMDDATWRRHANPWSVWTRFSVLPLLVLSAWSRVWWGWWSLLPVSLVVAWTWLNPRVFPAVRSLASYAARGVMGERVWLNRDLVLVPEHHRVLPNILNAVAGLGGIAVLWGVVSLRLWPTWLGFALVYLGKLWYVDRMVWLYEEMRGAVPEYSAWSDDPPSVSVGPEP